ncbi:hypothetical protein PT2222_330079 [Paraburkholderia tropica]
MAKKANGGLELLAAAVGAKGDDVAPVAASEVAAGTESGAISLEPAPDMDSSAGSSAADFVGDDERSDSGDDEYVSPTWAQFRTFVLNNGNRFVRATFPEPPADLIETIWCGVPVEHHERARVMTPKREWVDFADAESR